MGIWCSSRKDIIRSSQRTGYNIYYLNVLAGSARSMAGVRRPRLRLGAGPAGKKKIASPGGEMKNGDLIAESATADRSVSPHRLLNDSCSIEELPVRDCEWSGRRHFESHIVLAVLKKNCLLWRDRIHQIIAENPEANEVEIAWQVIRRNGVKALICDAGFHAGKWPQRPHITAD